MIKVLAIDDEPLALQQLAAYIKKVPFLQLMGECQSATEAKEILNRETIDAVFCDINMPDLNGMDFVKSLAAPPLVVFTTAYSEYAAPESVPEMHAQADEDDSIFVKTDYKVVKLAISDIRYIEGMSEYLKIHLESQPKPIVTLLSMKKMEEYLPAYFMRIHRSYIINLKKIQEVNKNRVIMDADTYLPVGDNYKDAFNDYLNTKFLGK